MRLALLSLVTVALVFSAASADAHPPAYRPYTTTMGAAMSTSSPRRVVPATNGQSTMISNGSFSTYPRATQNLSASPFQSLGVIPYTSQSALFSGTSPLGIAQTATYRNNLLSGTLAPLTGYSPFLNGTPTILPNGVITTFGLGLPFAGAGTSILTAGFNGQFIATPTASYGTYVLP